MKFFKMFDSFGLSIDFTINSNEKYKIAFGGIISIIMGIIWLILFFVFGQNCFNKLNPTGYSQLIPSDNNIKKAVTLNSINDNGLAFLELFILFNLFVLVILWILKYNFFKAIRKNKFEIFIKY